jgi:tetratricopeptide (TPR) repeat protein
MDLKTLNDYIASGVSINATDVRGIEELEQSLPWFAMPHILLLKHYKMEKDPRFDDKLRLAAMYSPSRHRLHRFLETVQIPEKPAAPADKPAEGSGTPQEKRRKRDPLRPLLTNEYFSPEEYEELSSENNDNDPINIFIRKNPRIVPPNAKNTPESIGVKDQNYNDTASETLAEIYCIQGLYDQALDCYSKLILHNPEKSSYFAGKIDDIKNKINR